MWSETRKISNSQPTRKTPIYQNRVYNYDAFMETSYWKRIMYMGPPNISTRRTSYTYIISWNIKTKWFLLSHLIRIIRSMIIIRLGRTKLRLRDGSQGNHSYVTAFVKIASLVYTRILEFYPLEFKWKVFILKISYNSHTNRSFFHIHQSWTLMSLRVRRTQGESIQPILGCAKILLNQWSRKRVIWLIVSTTESEDILIQQFFHFQ